MVQIVALRHMYSFPLAHIEAALQKHGFSPKHIDCFAADFSSFDPLEPDVLIVLGGAMGVYEADLYPYVHEEIKLLKKRIAADKPTLGICLGAQLMAASQGCNVYKGAAGKEHGFCPITLTEAGQKSPISHFSADKTKVLQIHGDTFDLPTNATLLASSDLYKNQAFQIGKNCFAVQFHPELSRETYENMLVDENGNIDVVATREEGRKHLPTMMAQTEKFIADLLKVWGLL